MRHQERENGIEVIDIHSFGVIDDKMHEMRERARFIIQ